MKLIIDIDEQHFELLQMAVMNGMGGNEQKIIAQGTPLPKGHGRLIDAEKVGHWGKEGECPFCGYYRKWEDDNFCGHCGAKMLPQPLQGRK